MNRTGKKPFAALLLVLLIAPVARSTDETPRVVRGPCVSFDEQKAPRIELQVRPEAKDVHVVATWKDSSGSSQSRDVTASGAGKLRFSLGSIAPSTSVSYEIFCGKASVGKHELETLPAKGPFVFCALGDTGLAKDGTRSADEWQLSVAKALEAEHPALVLHTGDVVYPNGQDELLEPLFFEPYAKTLSRVPFFCCLGNHDVRTEKGRPEIDAFPHPPNSNQDRYASFDVSNVHFVILDSNEPLKQRDFAESPQAKWLVADLAASRATWRIVVLHHPLYSALATRSWEITAVRKSLEKILDAGSVDLVLCGHDHFYHRTHRMLNDARNEQGIVHIVTGGGGAVLYPALSGSDTAACAHRFHYVKGRVDGSTLTLEAISPEGGKLEVIDSVTLSPRSGEGRRWR